MTSNEGKMSSNSPLPIHSASPGITPPQISYSVREILSGNGPQVNQHHDGRHNVYMAHKIAKLGNQNAVSSDGCVSHIFQSCAFFVNGYTTPPAIELKRLVIVNGGKFNQYETSDTTHYVCNQFPHTKLDRLKKGLEKRNIHYITVQWILDSISQGMKQREEEYRPRGLYDTSTQKLTSHFPQKAAIEEGSLTGKRKDFESSGSKDQARHVTPKINNTDCSPHDGKTSWNIIYTTPECTGTFQGTGYTLLKTLKR